MLKLSGFSHLSWGRETMPPSSNDDSKENGAKQSFLPHPALMNVSSPTKGGQSHLWLMHSKELGLYFSRPCHVAAQMTMSAPPHYLVRSMCIVCDTQTNMPSTKASGPKCVQKLDHSLDSDIHTKYRISLHSSS